MFSRGRISAEDDEPAELPRSVITDRNNSWVPIHISVKSCINGAHFTSVEKVQAKTENLLKGLGKKSFQKCYQQWEHRMQKCVNAEGNYLEGDTVIYMEAFGDGPRHFEPWSSEEDDTPELSPPSPNYHTTPTGGRLSSRRI
ncbi:hypothetical protein TNCV_2479461 [Trichonephila clavipes]|nr:hypothetical protein TNCV_2479461 [Trichonephila clavipes]